MKNNKLGNISASPAGIFLIILLIAGLVFAAVKLIGFIREIKQYNNGQYARITHKTYWDMRTDAGSLGEFMVYKTLLSHEANGAKFLFNLYIPAYDGKTTEIDVLMITDSGVFVFESKNYSGWIFGNESNRYWTVTLPSGKGESQKERFYNPIMQNRTHIKYLKKLVGEVPVWSVIAFSERCTLKDITVTSPDVWVVNRPEITNIVNARLAEAPQGTVNVDAVYALLYPYSQVSEEEKAQHIDDILEEHPDAGAPSGTAVGQRAANDAVCPLCGGKLVLRTVKRGENAGNKFYGCSNYPKCRYTKSIGD